MAKWAEKEENKAAALLPKIRHNLYFWFFFFIVQYNESFTCSSDLTEQNWRQEGRYAFLKDLPSSVFQSENESDLCACVPHKSESGFYCNELVFTVTVAI